MHYDKNHTKLRANKAVRKQSLAMFKG